MTTLAPTTRRIRKAVESLPVRPNLIDYDAECAGFSWSQARGALDGLPGGALNIAHEAVDRHAAGACAAATALRWLGRDGERRDISYAELAEASNRFANLLCELGVVQSERVFLLTGRIPELYVGLLGALKRGAVACTLFAAFGPEPVRERLALGSGRVLVTTPALYRAKVAPIRDRLGELEHVLLVGPPDEVAAVPGAIDLRRRLERADPSFTIADTRPASPALLHFTSGTTGRPKGAVHVHEAVVAHQATGRMALDLHPEDVYWCTADPGWVTGTSYGIIAPLVHGVTSVVDEADFDARRWYRILAEERVTVWYTAPTALRMLMRAGAPLAREHDLSALRFLASVGEPLNPEAVLWTADVLGLPAHDNWWQTETGGIMIANLAALDIKPGSMGVPLPGIHAAVARRDADGDVVIGASGPVLEDEPGVEGELVLRAGWPSMFRAYLHDDTRYQQAFSDGWYLTGDVVRRDEDGYFWFVSRGDDVIKSAGHLIGPFEVESALMEHPAVVEAGVVGIPDELVGERVKAFVVLQPGHAAGDALRRELLGFARVRLGAAVAPKEIEFRDHVPHTRSGKIMRRVLRARELGLPAGDTSTAEEQP
jgi:acetyl-CoA synthetase